MEELVLPPSPSWFLPNILTCRKDGSLAYGSRNNIVILKTASSKTFNTLIISAHKQRVTSVAFSPQNCSESFQNTVVSCSDDGLVKLWNIDTLIAFLGHDSHWMPNELQGKVISLDWSSANPHHIVSAADNHSLILWDILCNVTTKYSFPRLVTTVITCCPHNEKLVAVGTKSGLINIINLSGGGEIVYKLRGHDNEIQSLSWCPIYYNIFKTEVLCEEFLLASSCQNKEVFIWRAGSDGKCEISVQIPTGSLSKKDGSQGKLRNNFSYLALFWHSPYKLFFSSNFGELLIFDIKSYLINVLNKPLLKGTKHMQNCFSVGHNFHSKSLYAIASTPVTGSIVVYEGCKIKSDLKFKISEKIDLIKLNTENEKNVKWKVDVPEPICMFWTASQDRKLIATKFHKSNLKLVFNLGTMNGGVVALAPSPHDPNKIAIGSGDGLIRIWNILETSGEMQLYWQKIKDCVTSLAWHPTRDGLLAYGTSEGRVGLMDTNTNKRPIVFKPSHSHTIYALSWGPELSANETNNPKNDLNLYCVGDNTLSLYTVSKFQEDPLNLTKLIAFPCKKQTDVSWKPDFSVMSVGCDDGTIYLVEPVNFKIVQTVLAFKKTIYSIAWHPRATSVSSESSRYHSYFAAGSTDNENIVKVFTCEGSGVNFNVKQVASLNGHHGHIVHVSWSTHLDCRLLSTSVDGSVQIWDVITQSPLVNFTPIQKPMLSLWSPVSPDIVITGCYNGVLAVWKISRQTKTLPAPLPKNKKQKKTKEIQMVKPTQMEENMDRPTILSNEVTDETHSSIVFAERKNLETNVKEPKFFSRAWKSDSNQNYNRCYSMLKESHGEENISEFSLAFFQDDDRCYELTIQEEKNLKALNNWPEYYQLSTWNGKIKDVIEERIKTGQLDDFLVSLAPTVSFRLWQEACISYSKILVEKKLFRKAATYLVGCHKIYEGIGLLMDQDLYLEALYIARSRLPKSDPIFEEIVRRYAERLFKTGSYLKACECYLYLKDYLQVARICGKKSEAEFLSLAALAAQKCGAREIEIFEATKALLKCIEQNNFNLGERICRDHKDLNHLTLLYYTCETIHKLDTGKLVLNSEDILSYVRRLMENTVAPFPSCIPQIYQHHKVYKNKQEVFVVVAQELSRAISCSCEEDMLEHIIKALCTCCRFVQSSESDVDLLFKLCSWLNLIPTATLKPSYLFETENLEKKNSLREFVGAAIVRKLNNSSNPEDILSWMNTLHEMEDCFLNEKSFKYFKNIIDIGICEKRLMNNQNIINKIKLSSENAETEETTDISTSRPELMQVYPEAKEHHTTSDINVEIRVGTETSPENLNNPVISRNRGCDFDVPKNENCPSEDKNFLNQLRNEIEEFQAVKISAPNPTPVFFMLKQLCSAASESERAQALLRKLEEKKSKLY